jgi:hypothetical protein
MVAAFDEMKGHDGGVRPAYAELSRWLEEVPPDVLDYRRREAELLFRRRNHRPAASARVVPADRAARRASELTFRAPQMQHGYAAGDGGRALL